MRLMIWDTAGQEEFDSITKAYYRGLFECFDMARRLFLSRFLEGLECLQAPLHVFIWLIP